MFIQRVCMSQSLRVVIITTIMIRIIGHRSALYNHNVCSYIFFIVLLRCYQNHKCFTHIWTANCNVIPGHLYIQKNFTKYLFYKHCRFSVHVTLTIYLFYNCYRLKNTFTLTTYVLNSCYNIVTGCPVFCRIELTVYHKWIQQLLYSWYSTCIMQ